MFHWKLPHSAIKGLPPLTVDHPDPQVTVYVIGSCPIRLRGGVCVSEMPEANDPVIIFLPVDEASWHDRIADLIDAWEVALQTRETFWIEAVAERIRRVAEMSNGLIEFNAAT